MLNLLPSLLTETRPTLVAPQLCQTFLSRAITYGDLVESVGALTVVPSQDFVDEGEIPDAVSACFLVELIDAPHGL